MQNILLKRNIAYFYFLTSSCFSDFAFSFVHYLSQNCFFNFNSDQYFKEKEQHSHQILNLSLCYSKESLWVD